MDINVGELRHQCAYQSQNVPIVLVTPGGKPAGYRVVRFYPDTTDAHGKWALPTGTFKIEIAPLDDSTPAKTELSHHAQRP